MNSFQREYENNLATALDRIGEPTETRGEFGVIDCVDFVRLILRDGRQVELGVDERILNEGGMTDAIERELRAAAIRSPDSSKTIPA